MSNMRIKSHKPQFTQTKVPTVDRYTRYTPLGAIRLLPPLTASEVTIATTPTVETEGKGATKTRQKGKKRR